MPFSRLRKQFSIITMASSTTKPTETTSAISDRLLIEKPATHISAQVPASASGTVMPAAMVAAARRRNRNTTIITSAMEITSVSCMSNTLARIVPVRSDRISISTPAGIQRLISGSIARTRSTVSITLESADLVITSRIDGWPVVPAERAAVAHARLDRGDGGEPHHRAVGGPDDQRIVLRGGAELIVGGDGHGPLAAVERADRARGIGVGDRGAHVLHRQAHRRQRDRIDADADRRLLGAVDADLGDALDLRQPLRDHACRRRRTSRSAAQSCDVIARIMIGVADGLDLRNDGRDCRSPGRSVSAALIAACTSRAAPSMLRLRSNCTVMRVSPRTSARSSL